MNWWGLRGNPEWNVYFWSVRRTREEAAEAGGPNTPGDMLVELNISDAEGEHILQVNADRAAAMEKATAEHHERVEESGKVAAQARIAADEAWQAARDAVGLIRTKD
jgi:hypothetical protein